MSWDLAVRQCAAIRTAIISLDAQLASLEALAQQHLAKEAKPTARIELPETCQGQQPEDCARLNADAAVDVGGMGGAAVNLMCRGCGLKE